MAVSHTDSSSTSSRARSSDELSDQYDTDIDSNEADLLELNTPNLYDRPQHDPALEISAQKSSRQPLSNHNDDKKRAQSDKDRPVVQDSPIHFDEYWKDFNRRRQTGHQFPARPNHSSQRRLRYPNDRMNAHFPGSSSAASAFAYHDPRRQQPLINYVNNHWRSNSDASSDEYGTPSLKEVLAAPVTRKIFLIFLSIILITWYWASWGGPAWDERTSIDNAIRGRKSANGQLFGSNMRPDFAGMKHMETIDIDLIPGNGRIENLIFIGDVHGCHEELNALLDEIAFTPSTDHLIFTGDLIAKGPSSFEVIDLAIKHNASCVRGNHEDRLLLTHRDMNSRALPRLKNPIQQYKNAKQADPADLDGPSETDQYIDQPVASDHPHDGHPTTTTYEIDAEHFPFGANIDRTLVSSFTPQQLSYLASCPVLLHLGSLAPFGPTTVVHAGLTPGLDLHQQDPISAMNMRTLDLKYYVPSANSNGGAPWSRVWEKFQKRLPKKERGTVIYGHDSKRGLQLKKWSKGLDTGCVKGGRLTALVYRRRKGQGEGEVEVKSVECRDYRPKRGHEDIEMGQN